MKRLFEEPKLVIDILPVNNVIASSPPEFGVDGDEGDFDIFGETGE